MYTTSYPLNMWSTIKRGVGGDGKLHNLDKVDEYMLRGETEITPCTTGQAITDTQTDEVDVHNLTVESVSPEGVVYWSGEPETTVPITVTIEDNDLSDPVTLKLKIYDTGDDNRAEEWPPSATLEDDGITEGSHTFYWNGTPTGESYDTDYLPAGTYTYEVIATQTDSGNCRDCDGNPLSPAAAIQAGCISGDVETYRSEYLKIIRASDASGNPIYDVEYDGPDDNGTPTDPSDDRYYYIIRKYVLKDTLGANASEGVIWLYGPDGVKRGPGWDIPAQTCIAHPETPDDGLHASAVGTEHSLRFSVPKTAFDYAGTYRFVVHIKDAHGALYRNGQNRWALDLNNTGDQPGAIVWVTPGRISEKLDTRRNGQEMWKVISKDLYDPARRRSMPGYKAFGPQDKVGQPKWGGGGLVYGKGADDMLRSLNRMCLSHGEHARDAEYFLRKNDVWVFYGHAFRKGISFNYHGPFDPDTDVLSGDGIMNMQPENTDIFLYNITHEDFDLHHVRLAFLCGCFTAGGNIGLHTGTTIAESFEDKGAQAVVGWCRKTRPMSEFYRAWLAFFWDQVCTKGSTIAGAVGLANKTVLPDKAYQRKHYEFRMPAKCLGGTNTLLWQ